MCCECCENVSFGSRVIARIFGCFVVGRRKLGIMHPLSKTLRKNFNFKFPNTKLL